MVKIYRLLNLKILYLIFNWKIESPIGLDLINLSLKGNNFKEFIFVETIELVYSKLDCKYEKGPQMTSGCGALLKKKGGHSPPPVFYNLFGCTWEFS